MKTDRQKQDKVVHIFREQAGLGTEIVCSKSGDSGGVFHTWNETYGGGETNQSRRVMQLEEENAKLKKLVMDLTLDNSLLKELLSKDWAR